MDGSTIGDYSIILPDTLIPPGKKFDRFFPLLKFSYYKQIIRINSRYYSDFIK